MFFTYPIRSIQNNWVHTCIELAIRTICEALDAGDAVPEWPAILPEDHREILSSRRALRDRLTKFSDQAQRLSIAERADFISAFRQQNQIAGLLDGSVDVPVVGEVLQPLLDAAKDVCEEGFALLGKLELRGPHYRIIYESMEIKVCPFCGMEAFENPDLVNEDEDHYLLRRAYPLAASNFANLVPMGGKCNQRYKGQVDILQSNGIRRKALNPYGNITVAISLLNSSFIGGVPNWQIDITPAVEETDTWEQVFNVRERLVENVLKPYFDTWLSELSDWFDFRHIDRNADFQALSSAMEAFVVYKTKHREIGAAFLKHKVFEFLTDKFKRGDERVVEMIRSCLPTT